MSKGKPSADEMLNDIQEEYDIGRLTLSDWEISFINDMQDRVGDDKQLTERQLDKVEEIWDKI
jgi:hypothetical protein